MFLILIQIGLIQTKNYILQTNKSYASVSFEVVFGFPMSLVIIVGADFVYEKYVAKLQRDHSAIYSRFLSLLVIVAISAIAFVVILSVYLSHPQELRAWGLLSLIPFYLLWTVLASFFVFIIPGLVDPANKIPLY